MQKDAKPPLPASFGRYKPTRLIAHTTSSFVYHAVDPQLGNREVVIKILSRSTLSDEKSLTRFENEAAILAKLEHPSIVPLHDYGLEDGQPYLVMRYMPGGTLGDKMLGGPISPTFTCMMAQQVSKALDFAHRHGIIHRDVKPLNILFDEDGDACLSDFGIATLIQAQGQITGQGAIGTAVFMSPEQALGHTLTGASDIYSLGIMVFFCLAGCPPYDYSKDASTQAIMNQHVNTTPRRLRTVAPGLPASLDITVAKVLEKSPEKRFASAGEFAAALQAGLAGHEAPDFYGQPTVPTFSQTGEVQAAIWICGYCGYSFKGQNRPCPICGHGDLHRSD